MLSKLEQFKEDMAMEMFDKAQEAFNQSIKTNSNYFPSYNNLGRCYHLQHNRELALQYYNKALKINPKYPVALAYKGLSLGEQGKIKDALNHFKMALAVDKDYELAQISKKKALELLKSKKY